MNKKKIIKLLEKILPNNCLPCAEYGKCDLSNIGCKKWIGIEDPYCLACKIISKK